MWCYFSYLRCISEAKQFTRANNNQIYKGKFIHNIKILSVKQFFKEDYFTYIRDDQDFSPKVGLKYTLKLKYLFDVNILLSNIPQNTRKMIQKDLYESDLDKKYSMWKFDSYHIIILQMS